VMQALQRMSGAEAIAARELDAEAAGVNTSDEMTSDQAIRRMLEEGCRQVREHGDYPSKKRVAHLLNKMSGSTLLRLWVQVRNEGEEWPPR